MVTLLGSKRRTTVLRWLLFAYFAALSYATLVPAPFDLFGEDGQAMEQTIDSTFDDLVQHACCYAALGGLIVLGEWSRTVFFALALAAIGHGFGTEWVQEYIPLRYRSWPDAAANAVGVLLGLGIVAGAVHLISSRSRDS